jgi:hypothetical protein
MKSGTSISAEAQLASKHVKPYRLFIRQVAFHWRPISQTLRALGKSVDKFLINPKLSTDFLNFKSCACLTDTTNTHLHTPFKRM